MASLSSAAARSTTAGGPAAAVQRCFVPRLPRRGITAQAASSASGPLHKAAQRSDSSVRSPVAVASSNKGSQAAGEAGPAPAMLAAQQALKRRLAALMVVACWLLVLLAWSASAHWAVRLAMLPGMYVMAYSTKKMLDVADQLYVVEHLLCGTPVNCQLGAILFPPLANGSGNSLQHWTHPANPCKSGSCL